MNKKEIKNMINSYYSILDIKRLNRRIRIKKMGTEEEKEKLWNTFRQTLF